MYETKFPKLYKTSSTGKELEWEISVLTEDVSGQSPAILRVVYGQVDGKLQTNDLTISKGKNIGKANETTPYQQASSEAASKWQKQLDKCYSIERGGASKSLSPMLAHSYEDYGHKITFPSFVQPKLDGVRCVATKEKNCISLKSRQGKEFVGLNHIRQELLAEMRNGETWDGELYNPSITFQKLISLVKKDQPESIQVQYHIYDNIADSSFEERICRFVPEEGMLQFWGRYHLAAVTTLTVHSHEEIKSRQREFISLGYEGAIVRVADCKYKAGHRSQQLLKVKSWIDAEFTIIDVRPDIHGTQGIFICKTDNGGVFDVRIKGEDCEREYILQNPKEFIGKPLTVKFFEWTTSESPVPRFPVGLSVRNYE